MKLEQIGFYTLSDKRASQTSGISPMWRCEMLVTKNCNFKCPYCRGFNTFSRECGADINLDVALKTIDIWTTEGLKNIRFSGGEPTFYEHLNKLVKRCKKCGVEKIAISSNGSRDFWIYQELIDNGVNDFSISLDACCSTLGDTMAGVANNWDTVVENIYQLSRRTYVTVGVVLTKETAGDAKNIIKFAHELGVADIRIISAAQYNELVDGLSEIPQPILDAHPILKYRVDHFTQGRNVRGIQEYDTHRCYLVQDDSVVAGQWHFPCVINMREGGQPIGKVGPNMRQERVEWSKQHNTFTNPICCQNCLDIWIDYNNRCHSYHNRRHND